MHSGDEKNAMDRSNAAPVHPRHRVLAMFPFFNEEGKLSRLAAKMSEGLVDEFLGVNDGSSDNGLAELRARGIKFIDKSH